MKRRRSALKRRYGHISNATVTRPGARYEIWALYPKMRGGGLAKKRFFAGRGRDAHEVLATLWEYRASANAAGATRNQVYFVIDTHLKRGRMAQIVSEEELVKRKARGG